MLKIIRTYYFFLIPISILVYSCSDCDDPVENPKDPTFVIDIDSNVYPVVKICDQIWMAENLRVTRYRNGDEIPYKDKYHWKFNPPGEISYGIITGSDSIANIYGYVYHWVTINDSRGLAPSGWHIPSNLEWQELIDCLGGEDVAGNKLKEKGFAHWDKLNVKATNESGFTALPGSIRTSDLFINTENDAIGSWTQFWSSSECQDTNLIFNNLPIEFYGGKISLLSERENVTFGCSNRLYGLYVRCIKDK